MPRLVQIDAGELTNAGYRYNSSLNPTFLPGRYNHFSAPRRIFREGSLFQIPISVSPFARIPLFWLSLHHFSMPLYLFLANQALKKDGYLNLYFHPWEFVSLQQFGLPRYMQHNAGDVLAGRLERLITYFEEKKIVFGTLNECVDSFANR